MGLNLSGRLANGETKRRSPNTPKSARSPRNGADQIVLNGDINSRVCRA
jgi:hypothetical protein